MSSKYAQLERDYHTELDNKDLNEIKILNNNLQFLKEKRQKYMKWLFIIFLTLGIPIPILFMDLFEVIQNSPILRSISWTVIAFLLVIIISILVVLRSNMKNIQKVEGKIDNLVEFSKVKKAQEYFNKLMRINVLFIEQYYAQVKTHTSLSFSFSLVVGLLGFGLIITGLAIGFNSADNGAKEIISYIATGSGVLVEFIAGVFFYLYNKTVIQLKEYHEKLVNVQNILVANQLLELVDNNDERNSIISKIIEHLVRKDNHSAPVDNQK